MDPRAGAEASRCFRIDPGQSAAAKRAFFCWVNLRLYQDQEAPIVGKIKML